MMMSLEKIWHDWNKAVFLGESHTAQCLWRQAVSELPRKGGYGYLLVLSDTFSGWSEAFPPELPKPRRYHYAVTVQLMNTSRWRLLSPVMPEPVSVKRNYTKMKA